MASQVVPFVDTHNQKEEIRKLKAQGFWFSTVHNETYHFIAPNEWIYHRNQNPYERGPPTPGYARWYPTGRYSYNWIDFPNPDYPTMGNEEGRKMTHPDGVPTQWEQNPVVAGPSAGGPANTQRTWSQLVAAPPPTKGTGKGKGKAAPAPATAAKGAADGASKGAGKGKPAPAPNVAPGKAGAAVLTPAVPAAAGAAATAGTILPAGDGGAPAEQRRKRAADQQLTRGDQSPRAPSTTSDVSMSASSVIVNYISEQKGESRRMLNAILRQAVEKKAVHPEPGNKVSFDYEQFVDQGFIVDSPIREFNMNVCATEEATARCQLMAAHLMSLTVDPDTRSDETQMNQRMLEFTRRIMAMCEHLTQLHFNEALRDDKTAHRMGERVEQREYERIILYILQCAENQYKDNNKFDPKEYTPWFTSRDYNMFNLRRRFQRGMKKMRDQASLPFLHERHYRDLFRKILVGNWMTFVNEFQAKKDLPCPKEYEAYYNKYLDEEMLYDSDDNGKTDRKEYEKKVASATYKPRAEPQPITELSDDDKERLRVLMERINGIPIASAAAPPPPPPPTGPAVELPKAEAYSKPKVDGEPGFVQEFRERVHESAQLVKFVDEHYTSPDHKPEKKHSQISAAEPDENFVRNQVYEDVLPMYQSLQGVLMGEDRIDPTEYLDALKNTDDRVKDVPIVNRNTDQYLFSDIVLNLCINSGVQARRLHFKEAVENFKKYQKLFIPSSMTWPGDKNVANAAPTPDTYYEEKKVRYVGMRNNAPPGFRAIELMSSDQFNKINWKEWNQKRTEHGYTRSTASFPYIVTSTEQDSDGSYKYDIGRAKVPWSGGGRGKSEMVPVFRVNTKWEMVNQLTRGFKMVTLEDGSKIPYFEVLESIGSDSQLNRSLMAFADLRTAMNKYFSEYSEFGRGGHEGGVIIALGAGHIHKVADKKGSTGVGKTVDIGHSSRVSTKGSDSLSLMIFFLDSPMTYHCIPMQMPSLSAVLHDALQFALVSSMRHRYYVEKGDSKESTWDVALKGIKTGTIRDPAAQLLLDLGALNLMNTAHAIDLDEDGFTDQLDWPKDTKFERKPEKLLLESVLWSLRSKQSYQDLVDTIWKMFPEKSVHAEVFRLCLYCSVADIEMAYTDSGWPTNKKVTQPPATAYAERPTAFVGVPQTHVDTLTYINN